MGNVLVKAETLTSIADSIRAKAGTSEQLKPREMPSAIENIPSGGSTPDRSLPVRFFDYDGTLLYSYSYKEAAALTASPSLPEHDGLICQGWNWSLKEVKSQQRPIDVGALYITDDGATRIYIELSGDRLSPTFGFYQSKKDGVTIDWGDGSDPEKSGSATGTMLNNLQHTFPSAGKYMVSFLPDEDTTLQFKGTSAHGGEICYRGMTYRYYNYLYNNAVTKVECGRNLVLGDMAFYNFEALETVAVSQLNTELGINIFGNCVSLKMIVIPKRVQLLPGATAAYCYGLRNISLPLSIVNIGDMVVYQCYNLEDFAIPDTVSEILGSAFTYCNSIRKMDFPSLVTSIPSKTCSCMHSLIDVKLPDTLTSIAANSFEECYALGSIVIPEGVTSIGSLAFNNGNYKSVYLYPKTPPTMTDTYAFLGISSDAVMYVPKGCLEVYKAADYWSEYASRMVEMDS